MDDHKHIWKRSARKHKRKGFLFVTCDVCNITRQATIHYGALHIFTTGADKGGKSKVVTYRLKGWQQKILDDEGKTFVQHVDESFRKSVL